MMHNKGMHKWSHTQDPPFHEHDMQNKNSGDFPSTHSAKTEETKSDVRRIVQPSQYNQTSLHIPPEHYLHQFGNEALHNLETISVTPEAPWDDKGEELLRLWMDDATQCASGHKRSGYIIKSRHRCIQYGLIICAVLVFLASSLFECTDTTYAKAITVTASALNLLFAQINNMLDYGPLYERHFQYEALNTQYAIYIQEILCTDADFRSPKDQTLTELREKKKQLVLGPEWVK